MAATGDRHPSILVEFARLCGHAEPEYAVAEEMDYYAGSTTATVADVNARIDTEVLDASYVDVETGDDVLIRKLCMITREAEEQGARIRAVEEIHAAMDIPELKGWPIKACRECSEGKRSGGDPHRRGWKLAGGFCSGTGCGGRQAERRDHPDDHRATYRAPTRNRPPTTARNRLPVVTARESASGSEAEIFLQIRGPGTSD
ncbi:hypothetical protein HC031_22355 [Planosporangium thailandense]|uniref:Uncharacterized protein n=1 Tax=Planosporangium thailandense TaxID=765197 RepID=A0ABX0Y343_9ACTN|nr:hypothetical protein [Planosporangium thailandense]NJC72438.1 hypothetical protein [Planosporangium thailandense]